MSLVNEKSALLLRYLAINSPASFKELNAIIKNTATLTKRLQWLVSRNIIIKQSRAYKLSAQGTQIAIHLREIDMILNIDEFPIDPFQRIANGYIVNVLRDYLSILKNHFETRLLTVCLFGSCARGDWTRKSDIDLLVIVKNWTIPVWERIRELIALKKQLREKSAYKAMLLSDIHFPITHYPLADSNLEEFHPILMDVILDGIILYQRHNYGTNLFEGYQKELAKRKAIRITKPNNVRYWQLGGN